MPGPPRPAAPHLAGAQRRLALRRIGGRAPATPTRPALSQPTCVVAVHALSLSLNLPRFVPIQPCFHASPVASKRVNASLVACLGRPCRLLSRWRNCTPRQLDSSTPPPLPPPPRCSSSLLAAPRVHIHKNLKPKRRATPTSRARPSHCISQPILLCNMNVMLGAEIGPGPAAKAWLGPGQAVEWRRPRQNRRPDASRSEHSTQQGCVPPARQRPNHVTLLSRVARSPPHAPALCSKSYGDIEHRVARPGLRHRHRARCGRHAAACRRASASLGWALRRRRRPSAVARVRPCVPPSPLLQAPSCTHTATPSTGPARRGCTYAGSACGARPSTGTPRGWRRCAAEGGDRCKRAKLGRGGRQACHPQ